jgi:hypothetical protein
MASTSLTRGIEVGSTISNAALKLSAKKNKAKAIQIDLFAGLERQGFYGDRMGSDLREHQINNQDLHCLSFYNSGKHC